MQNPNLHHHINNQMFGTPLPEGVQPLQNGPSIQMVAPPEGGGIASGPVKRRVEYDQNAGEMVDVPTEDEKAAGESKRASNGVWDNAVDDAGKVAHFLGSSIKVVGRGITNGLRPPEGGVLHNITGK